ncbi:MAG: oligosaccharide flippase family protein [Candidatus Methanofastidiosum sp.]|nr:oligosaccharide flippase family protein [Methanofastidiosum sp.]
MNKFKKGKCGLRINKSDIIFTLKSTKNNNNTKKYAYQATIQLISNFVTLVLSFLINIVATKNIDPNAYGEYRYVVNYLLMIPGLINLGYPNSAGRIAAISQETEQSKISGYGFTVSFITALIYILISIPLISVLNANEIINITWYAIYFTPYIILSTMQLTVKAILTGQNKIYSLSIFNLIPQTLIFIVVLVQIYVFRYTNTLTLLIPYVVINGLAIIYRIYKCNPIRVKISESFLALKEENKRFGFKVYIGSIFGVIVGQVIGLISGSFVGMENYGYFSLAFSFVAPFQMLASTFGTVLYKSNVKRKRLSFQLFSFVIGFNLVAYLLFYIFIDYFFISIFSIEYIQSLSYMKVLALYGICLGLGDFINRFLGAKGYGKTLMTGAIFSGLSMIIAAIIFVPKFKVIGLIVAFMLSGLVYLLSMVTGYINYRRSNIGGDKL